MSLCKVAIDENCRRLIFVHYYDKAAASRGIDFDPDKPVVLVPHPKVGSRLLLYLGVVLPIVVFCSHRRILHRKSISPLNNVSFDNCRLILALKAQHPFIPFAWSGSQGADVKVSKAQVLTNADHAYSRTFREMSLKCKLILEEVSYIYPKDNRGQELTLSSYRHFLSKVMKKINVGYLNGREERSAQLVSHQSFQHSAATSKLYGQTGEGLNLVVAGELKV